MSRGILALLACSVFCALMACGQSTRIDPRDSDVGDTNARSDVDLHDADADRAGDADALNDSDVEEVDGPTCPFPPDESCEPSIRLEPLLTAEEVAEDVRFIAFGDHALLIEYDGGYGRQPWLVLYNLAEEVFCLHGIPLGSPTSPPRAVGLVSMIREFGHDRLYGYSSVGGYVVFVLVHDGSGYSLLGVEGDTDSPLDAVAVHVTDVPAVEELRGIALFANELTFDSAEVCAFGDGVFCFDGDLWTTRVEPGMGPLFNDAHRLALSSPNRWLLLVGDEGRIVDLHLAGWSEREPPVTDDLISVNMASDPYTWAAASSSGTMVFGDQHVAFPCDFLNERIVGVSFDSCYRMDHDIPGTPPLCLAGVTESGWVFSSEMDVGFPSEGRAPSCLARRVSGTVLQGDRHWCGQRFNLFVLTEDTLYGDDRCFVW